MTDWADDIDGGWSSRGHMGKGWQNGGLVLAVAIALWLLGFVTGLAPWLGYRDYDYRSGAVDLSSNTRVGTNAMLLLRGQTAYVDYEVAGDPGEAIYVDVAPSPGIKFSPRMRRVPAGEAGRAEFPIERTGLYHFKVSPTPDSYRDTMRFEASWGAR